MVYGIPPPKVPLGRRVRTPTEWPWSVLLMGGGKGRPKLMWTHWQKGWNTPQRLGVRPKWLLGTESSWELWWKTYASRSTKRIKLSYNNYAVQCPWSLFRTLTSKKLQFVISTHSTPATLISLSITLSLLLSGSNANIFLQKVPHYFFNHSYM